LTVALSPFGGEKAIAFEDLALVQGLRGRKELIKFLAK
jgi:hypothetical protein